MCTAITYQTKDHYFGRNLDLDYVYQETVTITPRRYPLRFRQMGTLDRHYAMIGMAYVLGDYPLYYDATNEAGLSMAGLNFPGNAVYCGTKHFVRAMLDSFRTESVAEGTNIRTTTIYPGAIKTELLHTIAPSETKSMVEAFYDQVGLDAEVIADAVVYALSQPDNVDVSDLTVRPSRES